MLEPQRCACGRVIEAAYLPGSSCEDCWADRQQTIDDFPPEPLPYVPKIELLADLISLGHDPRLGFTTKDRLWVGINRRRTNKSILCIASIDDDI